MFLCSEICLLNARIQNVLTTDLPREAIGPNCFSRGFIPEFVKKPFATSGPPVPGLSLDPPMNLLATPVI